MDILKTTQITTHSKKRLLSRLQDLAPLPPELSRKAREVLEKRKQKVEQTPKRKMK